MLTARRPVPRPSARSAPLPAERTGVRQWVHGLAEPPDPVGRAGAAAVQRPLAGRAVLERRRRQPGVVPQAPALSSRSSPAGPVPCPTPSCTATRTSRSWTAPPTPRSWPRRRPGWAWRRWPSPTTTASTASCASPRRRGRSGCRRCSAPSSRSARASGPRTASPTRRATTWSCWPTARPGLRRPGPGPQPRPAGRREGRPPLHPRRPGRRGHRALVGAHRLPQGRGAGGAGGPRARPPPPGPATAGRRLRARPGAVELWDHGDPLDSARNDALAELAVRAGVTLRRHRQRPLRHARARPARWPRAGRGAGPPQPRRARPLAPGLQLATCARAPSRPGASPATRAWWRRRPRSGGPAPSTSPSSPPSCRRSPAPTGSSEMAYLRQLVAEGVARRYAALAPEHPEPRPGPRSTTSWTSSRASASPATSSSCGTSCGSARASDIYCQGRGSAANSAVCYALGVTNAEPSASACCSSASCRPSATARPTSTSTSRAAGGRRPSSTSTALRPRAHRPGGQRHHLPGPVGGAGHGQGARVRPRPAGRVVEAGRRLGPGRGHGPPARPRHPGAGAAAGRRRWRTSPATSASTPAAW